MARTGGLLALLVLAVQLVWAAADELCSSQEYYCTSSDVFLDTAFAAASGSNCTADTDLGVWFCGSVVVANATYAALQAEKGTCAADCVQSSATLALPTQYYWNASAWASCPVSCNGSLQIRTVSCVNSVDSSLVGSGLCPAAEKPAVSRPCGLTPCEVSAGGLSLQLTPWAACEATCGTGLATRSGYCADPSGFLADVEACPSYSGSQLSRQCSSTACTQPHWTAASWGACNVTCGGGIAMRNVSCVDGSGKATNTSLCPSSDVPAASRVCNTAPCIGYTWQVGPWGNCSLSCGGGVRNRTTVCVNEVGQAVSNSQCPGAVPADQIQCNVLPCNFCDTTTCAGQGVCKNGTCVCTQGYRGDYCEIAPACTGILDSAGNCCSSAVVSTSGVCCSTAGAKLDQYGQCCSSGKVDACGVCDGTAQLVDVQGVCCASGVLDGSGYCCTSSLLDECGVCDGNSTSCALQSTVTVQVSQPESLVSLGSQAFVTSFSSFIAAALAVNVSLVSVLDYVLAPGAQLSATVATVPMVVEFSVSPPDSYSPGQDLRAAVATPALQAALGESSTSSVFILTSVEDVERTAICGNQVCEPGERVPSSSGIGCPSDCPFPLTPCSNSSGASAACSGAGTCLTASGTCICFVGYDGADCSQCAEGYMRANGMCARYVKADLPLLDAQSSHASAYVPLAVGIGVGVLGMLLAVGMVFVSIRQHRELQRLRRVQWRREKSSRALRQSLLRNVAAAEEDAVPQTRAAKLLAPVKRVAQALDAARKELHEQGQYLALGSGSPANSLPSPDTLAAAIHVPSPLKDDARQQAIAPTGPAADNTILAARSQAARSPGPAASSSVQMTSAGEDRTEAAHPLEPAAAASSSQAGTSSEQPKSPGHLHHHRRHHHERGLSPMDMQAVLSGMHHAASRKEPPKRERPRRSVSTAPRGDTSALESVQPYVSRATNALRSLRTTVSRRSEQRAGSPGRTRDLDPGGHEWQSSSPPARVRDWGLQAQALQEGSSEGSEAEAVPAKTPLLQSRRQTEQ